jgi:hypothetical protein
MSDNGTGKIPRSAEETDSIAEGAPAISRRTFVGSAAVAGTALAALGVSAQIQGADSQRGAGHGAVNGDHGMADEIVKAKIRRALLSGPDAITKYATVSEMDAHGKMTVLRPGTNQWVCIPGNENIIGQADMSVDPMGMLWLMDIMARKPKPSNSAPGLIYMLNGATQHSYTDPFDRTSPAIPIGPHWMIIWPFDAKAAGLSTVMRDAGTMVMFAGTPYAHLHVCGSPWDGNEYHPGDRGVWTMTYARP